MECKFVSCFISLLIIYITGVSTVTLVPSANPVAAGGNITLSVNPVISISAGTWLFQSSILAFWYPDNLMLGEGYAGRVSFNSSTLQLTLRSVQANDSGLYVLQGVSPSVRAEVTLSIQEPITNVSLTASKTDLVEFNDSVSFACSAHGTPLTYSWNNGSSEVTAGVNVQLSNNGSVLTISNVTRYDTGPFTCVVANGISNGTSRSLYLNISYGPSNLTMTVLPEKMGYISGSNITLSCSADSSPPVLFYWSYNGMSLNKTGQTLQLLNASQNKTGPYTCTAHNTVTLRYTTATKTVRIIDAVSAAEVTAVNDVPIFNMSFALTCEVLGPVDSVYWMKNGLYLYSDSKVSLSNQNKTLSFSRLALSDNGKYQCVASNTVSNKTSMAYTLAVNYGPWNVSISGPAIAQKDSSITLNCSASSQPPSDYSWYYNGSQVAKGAVYKTGPLSLNSSGEYTCIAHNNITGNNGSATWNLTVIVGISSVVVTPSMPIPLASKGLQLFCNVTGDYKSISWLKDNRTFSPTSTATISADNTTVDFLPLQISDDGAYQCAATNIAGKHVSIPYKLTANYGPVDLRITATKEIILTCEAMSQPPSVYHWIFNNDTDVREGPTIAVPLMTPVGSNYTCVARNPLTNVTLSGSYIISDYSAASPLQPSALVTALLLLALPLLTLWL
ncbi:carcinoembryonic antigen-related cell adhesion molecule 5-like [Colossoma macropomum]|uniref:carcinoembryonic antigen-related cell adhesion molecule 5-like n=1 Tax=Colossoma macropomum TaxID=42526 RepID=UPI001863C48F|nr:carcinoembryonic antigen-related cell adhesion molecule 5-like [Colossoma macropomum]